MSDPSPLISSTPASDKFSKLIDPWQKGAAIVAAGFAIAGVIGGLISLQEIKTQNIRQSKIASATLVLEIRRQLEGTRYAELTKTIQENDQHYSLLTPKDGGKSGKFDGTSIEEYIGNFEDLGYLITDGVVDSTMAYHHFSYDVEKAWCNDDVQKVVAEARKADKSRNTRIDPIYGRFERLAREYLTTEGQSCEDMNHQ